MHETPDDMAALQALLDDSYERAGKHLREIVTPERRLSAEQVCERLQGMRLLVVATVTADGRPISGPFDGIFYRGAFYFGSSPESVRFRHIRKRPWVSATHLPGEELSVSVHGKAAIVEPLAPENKGFLDAVLGIYVPRYGEEWAKILDDGALYARIDAERMLTFNGEGLEVPV
ncbi:MAG TPA: pyridoxamine 5'-phosphate oxidase family protein [Acidimicrobiales bacterium]|nr:pyridoxamine 5'-phosphate oxidase family protein [Acidimicrobiales bacterium]